MNEPRIHVQSKGKHQHRPTKNTQNWTARKQSDSSSDPARTETSKQDKVDSWSHHLKKRNGPRKANGILPKAKRWKPKAFKKRRPSFFTPRGGPAPRKGKDDSGNALLKLATSAGSAVLVGTLMGLVILKVFVGGDVSNGTSIDTHLEDQTTDTTDQDKSAEAESTTSSLPEIDVVWVQGGVYSDRAGADTAVEKQREQGMAAIRIPMDDQYRVFYGMAFSRDNALMMASKIKEAGGDVFLKDNLPIEPTAAGQLSEETRTQLNQLGDSGKSILSAFVNLTAEGIGGRDIADSLKEKLNSSREAHQGFLAALKKLKGNLAEDQNEALLGMEQSLSQVIEAFNQYVEDTSPTYLWQAQEGMMTYLMSYRQLGQ